MTTERAPTRTPSATQGSPGWHCCGPPMGSSGPPWSRVWCWSPLRHRRPSSRRWTRVRLRPDRCRRCPIRPAAAPSAEHWFGTSVRGEDVFSRVIYGARTALMVIVLVAGGLAGGRRGARPDLRIHRWMGRSGAGVGHGCDVCDAVAATGDRRLDRGRRRAVGNLGGILRGHRDHGGVRAAVLPGGSQRDGRGQERTVRRCRQGDRSQHVTNPVPAHTGQRHRHCR